MSRSQKTFVPIWALLLALCPTPKLLANSLSSVLAQSPSFTLPESLPKGTTVRVNGSSSMIKVNEVLKQRYEEKFSNTQVELAAGSSDDALEALQQGDVDIAAVGRSLTETEKAAGLVAVPIDRAKIAIIIGPNNSFDGNLTFEQFARIFRGEITDWSEIGGEPGPIRLVDRPDFSDTRRALSGYEVFKTAPFETGSNADQVSQDNTSDVIQALGNDGISYAIADQVLEEDNVKIVSMHQTFPDDPRYPYSQIRTYVYNKEATNPANLAFLGFATSEPGQEVIVATPSSPSNGTETDPATTTATSPDGTETDPATITAIPPDAAASPEGTTDATTALIPESDVAATTTNRGLPWWLWLLGIPLLGGLLWWLLKGRGSEPTGITSIPPGTGTTVTPPATPEVAAGDTNISAVGTITTPDSPATSPITASPPSSPNGLNLGTAGLVGAGLAGLAGALAWSRRPLSSQITLSPEENQNVKAVWDIPEADISQAQQQGGQQFKLRVYDVTDIDIETEPPHNVQEHDCDESISELTVPVEQGDRNYLAEVGYMTEDQQWLPLCRSNAVYVPPSNLPEVETPEVPNVNLGLNTPSVDLPEVETPNVPNVNLGLNAPSVDLPEIETPEVPDVNLELSQASVDVPEIETPDVPNVNLGLDTPSVDLPEVETPEIPDVNLGLNTPSVDLPEVETPNVPNVNLGLNTPSVDLPEVETPEVPDVNLEGSQPSVDLPETPSSGINLPGLAALSGAALASLGAIPFFGSRQSRITLTPETDQNVKAVWNIPEADISQAQQQGGQQFKLRVYDVTDIDIEVEPPHNVQEHDCDESISELTVPVEQGDRNYLAEVGYMTEDQQWLPLCRSNAVYVPPSSLPEVETPEVPNVNLGLDTPSVDIPEIETPEIPDVNLGLDTPSVDLPEVETPEIPDVNLGLDTPSVDVPEIETPEIPDVNLGLNTPSVDLPEVETPDVPDVNLGLDTPSVDLPEVETPDVPDVNLELSQPETDIADTEAPETEDEDTPSGDMNLPGIALGGLAVASIGAIPLVGSEQSRLSVTPTDNQTLSATWEIPQGDIDAVKQQGGQQLQLRVYDVTDTDSDAHTQTPQNVQQYDCDESTQDLEVSIEQGDRTYAAAIGYITDDDQWLPLCCSDSVYVPPSDLSTTEDSTVTEIGSDFTSSPTDVGDGDEVDPEVEEPAIAEEEAEEELDSTPTDSTEIEDSETESEDISDDIVNSPEITVDNAPVVSVVSSPLSQLTLTPTIDQGLEASWEIPQADIDAVKEQGGQRLQLRVYDVTDMNEASQNPESMQQYDCGESIKSLRLSLPQGDCTYAAAIGYVTHDDQWLPLCRSNIIFVPASQPVTTEVITAEPTIAANPILQHDCEIQHLTVNSRSHCFLFHPEQMQALKETALSKILEPGIHIIQIKSGTFGYGSADATREPIVLLLIDGGKVINKKTNVPVELTWSSLNGYHETLTLEVLETSTLSAFFFDINPDDNYGYLTLSIIQPYG